MYCSNTCIETQYVYTIGIAASSTSWCVLGVTGFLLHWGGRFIISRVILHQLTTAFFFPSATDEDHQTGNVDSEEDNKEDVNDPGGSLHMEKKGVGVGWREREQGTSKSQWVPKGVRNKHGLTSACFALLNQHTSSLSPHELSWFGNPDLSHEL